MTQDMVMNHWMRTGHNADKYLKVLAAVALCATAACDRKPYAGAGDAAGWRVYVTNEDSGTLSVISPASDAVVRTISVGRRPRGVKVTRDGHFAYVAVSGSPKCPPSMADEECAKLVADPARDGVAVIDLVAGRRVRLLPAGTDPEQFDLSKDERRLIVSNEDAGLASIVDTESGAKIAQIAVGPEPEGVRTAPDGRFALVTSEAGDMVTAVALANYRAAGSLKVGHRPRDVVFAPGGNTAYVSCESGGTVAAIGTEPLRLLRTITLPEGMLPMGLALSADGQKLYVATGRGKDAVAIDTTSGRVAGSVRVGARPWGIGLSPDGTRFYTANGPSNDVSVIDTKTLAVVARIAVGRGPWGLAVAPRPPGG